MFGVGNGKISTRMGDRIHRIAQKHGAFFTWADMGDGPRYWFECKNRGEPFDSAIARAVLGAVSAAGIVLP